jgi:predicted dehydrogenase
MHRLTTAIIGGGKISEQHLGTLNNLEGVEVSGICDLSPALARFTAERFGVSEWFTDYQKMLTQVKADVIHVLTPPATHDRLVRDCLAAGKHVIIEKPVALSHEGFRSLWDLAASRGLRLVENHNYRFNEQAVAAGRMGRVEEVEVRISLNIRGGGRYADENLPHPSHQLPAGIIHEFITHLAYLFLHFLPGGYETKIDSVRACWRNHGGGDLFKVDDLDAVILADTTHGRLRFTSRQWPDSFAVQVRCSDGTATAELFHPLCQVTTRQAVGQHLTPMVNAFSGARTLMGSGFGSIWRKIRNRGAYDGLSRFLELTYAALRTGEEPPVAYRQMDSTTRLVDRLLAEENRL